MFDILNGAAGGDVTVLENKLTAAGLDHPLVHCC
jgi:hypothetical protein